jgi:Capsule polysaccharide biosynthesis protein
MSNRVLIYSPLAGSKPHFETDLELAEDYLQQGYEVLFLTCNRDVPSCDLNPKHEFGKCYRCLSRQDSGINWLKKDDSSRKLWVKSFYWIEEKQKQTIDSILKQSFNTAKDLRNLVVDDSDIGLSVLSSIVSILREPNPDLTCYQELVQSQLITALTVHFSIMNHLQNYRPDEFILYNGRLSVLRPALRVAQQLGIQSYVHELAGVLDRYSLTSNTSTHDLKFMKELIHDFYYESSLPPEEKRDIAASWFEERQVNQDSSGFYFTKSQEIGLVPDSIKSSTLSVSIFISSEDEMVAIGGWENPYYEDQNDGLEKIFSDFSNDEDVQFILRIHPHLKNVDNSQTRYLNAFGGRFKNVEVVSADSKVSTYSLLQSSDIVIAFGSTIGIEACYQKKAIILLGRAMYEDAKSLIKPKSHEDLIQILRTSIRSKQPPEVEVHEPDWIAYGFFQKCYGKSFKFVRHRDLYQVELHRQGIISRIQANIPSRILARLPF